MLVSKADDIIAANERSTARLLVKQLPSIGNIVAVEALTATVRFQYRGRVFDAPPIPVLPGLRLQAMELELEKMAPAESDEDAQEKLLLLKTMLLEMFDIMWKNVRPVKLIDRILWRLERNPFLDANRKEVAELLSFFSQCRKTSSVRIVRVKSPENLLLQ